MDLLTRENMLLIAHKRQLIIDANKSLIKKCDMMILIIQC